MTRCPHSCAAARSSAIFIRSCGLAVELLERRVLLSAFTVTNTSDSGPGSLRQAILDADAVPAVTNAIIQFNIPGTGVQTIAPVSALPAITHAVTLTGSSQPGYGSSGGAPVIEISGVNAGAGVSGLTFAMGAGGSTLTALTINRFAGNGLILQASNVQVSGCFIGTNAAGTGAAGNGQDGVVALGQSENLGGVGANHNVISANGLAGVYIASAGAVVLNGNYIGTSASGAAALGNRQEGLLDNGQARTGDGAVDPNVISGNGSSGIVELGSTATLSLLAAYIGTNAQGSVALPNGANFGAPYRDGITILGGRATIGRTPTTIQGSDQANVISGNEGAGIDFVAGTDLTISGNLIGTDATGTSPIGNAGNGINLASAGATVGIFIGSLPPSAPLTSTGGNVIAANGGDGILILAPNTQVRNNYIGLNLPGAAAGNRGGGIEIRSINNVIGVQHGNVISANGKAGISIANPPPSGESQVIANNTIQSNIIGANPTATAPLGNGGNGIEAFASGNTIGGVAGMGNLIVANGGNGILLRDFNGVAQSGNRITGNSIGAGRAPGQSLAVVNFGNAGDGITIHHSFNNRILLNTIGSNGDNGVSVSAAIPNGPGAIGNLISQNTFAPNGGLDIDLGDDGVTPNDPGDADVGPNQLQNFPVIQSGLVNTQSTVVQFQLDTLPGTYTVEFYSPSASIPNPLIAGTKYFLASANITVGTTPNAVYTASLPRTNPVLPLWATATDSSGNTSEFSPPAALSTTPPRVTFTQYSYFTLSQVITVHFNEDVSGGLLPSSVSLHNLHTGGDVTPVSVSFDPNADTARFTLPDSMPDGYYQVTVSAAGVMNAFGQHLDGNGDGIGGDDYTYTLYSLTADLNGDHQVGFADLLLLAQGYGSRTQPALDINGDGVIDFKDLLILAQHYGEQVTGA